MPGGYSVPTTGELGPIIRVIDQMQRDIRELGRPTGTQTAESLKQLRDLVNGLIEQTEVNVSGSVTAGGNVTATGLVTGTAGMHSLGVFNTDVTLLPGTRTPVWVNVNGTMGQTISTITKKSELSTELPFTAAQVMACIPYVYAYIGQLAIRDDPENPYYDPAYVVPLEIGLMAEHLVDNGLGIFVFYEEDGTTPKGIDYALFGAIANLVVLRDHEDRLRAAGI